MCAYLPSIYILLGEMAKPSAHVLVGLFVFLLVVFESALNLLNPSALSDM